MSDHEEGIEGGISIGGGISVGRAARAKDRDVAGLDAAAAGGVDPESLWATMRRAPAAVTVLAASGDEGYVGITVSALCLVSLDPPLVLACLHNGSQVLDAIASSGAFALTVLGGRQELVAEMFAGRAPRPDPTFAAIRHRTLVTGAPVIEGGLAWLDCRLHQTYPGGDHTIAVGLVVGAGVAPGQDDPLIYFGSQYRRLAP